MVNLCPTKITSVNSFTRLHPTPHPLLSVLSASIVCECFGPNQPLLVGPQMIGVKWLLPRSSNRLFLQRWQFKFIILSRLFCYFRICSLFSSFLFHLHTSQKRPVQRFVVYRGYVLRVKTLRLIVYKGSYRETDFYLTQTLSFYLCISVGFVPRGQFVLLELNDVIF